MKWHHPDENHWISETLRQDSVQIRGFIDRRGERFFWHVDVDGRRAATGKGVAGLVKAQTKARLAMVNLLHLYKPHGWPKGANAVENDEIARANGFKDAREFQDMIAAVDIATPDGWNGLKWWHAEDGTREGLAALPVKGEVVK